MDRAIINLMEFDVESIEKRLQYIETDLRFGSYKTISMWLDLIKNDLSLIKEELVKEKIEQEAIKHMQKDWFNESN